MMKLAFKKVGEGGNDEEGNNEEIADLADEDSEDEEGDLEEEAEETSKPGFLRRARNTVKASIGIGTRMTNSEACATVYLLFPSLLQPHFPF